MVMKLGIKPSNKKGAGSRIGYSKIFYKTRLKEKESKKVSYLSF